MPSARSDRPLVWLHGEVRSPPFSRQARIEAGELLRRLQKGESLHLPQSRPMPVIGRGCHELRIMDADVSWRIVYYLGREAVVILSVFAKQTQQTPGREIQARRKRLNRYLYDLENG